MILKQKSFIFIKTFYALKTGGPSVNNNLEDTLSHVIDKFTYEQEQWLRYGFKTWVEIIKFCICTHSLLSFALT